MDIFLVEIVLWAGLAFFFWTLRENLGNVEAELEEAQALKSREIAARALARRFVRPEEASEPIGHYRDTIIHRQVKIGGHPYRFDFVCPPEGGLVLKPDQCYVAPGIVYVRAEESGVTTGLSQT